jgi:glycosyltransferase
MKVSIITAVLNSKAHMRDCVASVFAQSYPDIEHIIVDGGSTDGTLDVIRAHDKKIAKWISEPDQGIYDAMNKGISLSSGTLIGILNADDLYAHNRVIETVVASIETHGVDSCYGDLLYVDKEDTDRTIRHWKSCAFEEGLIQKGWMPPHPTFFVKSKIYDKFGSFDTRLKIAADYELMLRFLGTHKISTHYIPEVLIRMRVGGRSNRSIGNLLKKSSEDYLVMKLHHVGGFVTLLRKNVSKIPQFFKK